MISLLTNSTEGQRYRGDAARRISHHLTLTLSWKEREPNWDCQCDTGFYRLGLRSAARPELLAVCLQKVSLAKVAATGREGDQVSIAGEEQRPRKVLTGIAQKRRF